MKYGYILNETVYLYFEVVDGKRISGNIDYNEKGERKLPADVIIEKGLQEVIVPNDFDGNTTHYNYVERDGKIVLAGLKDEVSTEKQRQADISRISTLKRELASEDYKVIKCIESQMNSLELPYNIVELTASRNAKREEINLLEQKWGL